MARSPDDLEDPSPNAGSLTVAIDLDRHSGDTLRPVSPTVVLIAGHGPEPAEEVRPSHRADSNGAPSSSGKRCSISDRAPGPRQGPQRHVVDTRHTS